MIPVPRQAAPLCSSFPPLACDHRACKSRRGSVVFATRSAGQIRSYADTFARSWNGLSAVISSARRAAGPMRQVEAILQCVPRFRHRQARRRHRAGLALRMYQRITRSGTKMPPPIARSVSRLSVIVSFAGADAARDGRRRTSTRIGSGATSRFGPTIQFKCLASVPLSRDVYHFAATLASTTITRGDPYLRG